MPKRADLTTTLDSMREEAGSRVAPSRTPSRRAADRPSRAGTVSLTLHVPAAVRDHLKIIAVETGTTLNALCGEGLNSILAQHGRPELAPTTPGRPGRPPKRGDLTARA